MDVNAEETQIKYKKIEKKRNMEPLSKRTIIIIVSVVVSVILVAVGLTLGLVYGLKPSASNTPVTPTPIPVTPIPLPKTVERIFPSKVYVPVASDTSTRLMTFETKNFAISGFAIGQVFSDTPSVNVAVAAPTGDLLYLICQTAVVVVNVSTANPYVIMKRIDIVDAKEPLRKNPVDAIITPDGNNLFIACAGEVGSNPGGVLQINLATNDVTNFIVSSRLVNPRGLVSDAEGNLVYVCCSGFTNGQIAVIDLRFPKAPVVQPTNLVLEQTTQLARCDKAFLTSDNQYLYSVPTTEGDAYLYRINLSASPPLVERSVHSVSNTSVTAANLRLDGKVLYCFQPKSQNAWAVHTELDSNVREALPLGSSPFSSNAFITDMGMNQTTIVVSLADKGMGYLVCLQDAQDFPLAVPTVNYKSGSGFASRMTQLSTLVYDGSV